MFAALVTLSVTGMKPDLTGSFNPSSGQRHELEADVKASNHPTLGTVTLTISGTTKP